jgi:hypothetical protein
MQYEEIFWVEFEQKHTIRAIRGSYYIFEKNRSHGVVVELVADKLEKFLGIDGELLVHLICDGILARPKPLYSCHFYRLLFMSKMLLSGSRKA